MYKLPEPFSDTISSIYFAKSSVSRSRSGRHPIDDTLISTVSSVTGRRPDDALGRFGGDASGSFRIFFFGQPLFFGVVFSLDSSDTVVTLLDCPRVLRVIRDIPSDNELTIKLHSITHRSLDKIYS